jgi:hypothetical protein
VATSGSWDYSVTAANVIQAAYEDLGVIEPGATVASTDSAMALTRLNLLVKQWQGQTDFAPGLKVWTRQRIALFLEYGQQEYLVGPASGDSRCSTGWGHTTIDVAEAASQTVISVAATTDSTTNPRSSDTMTASDIIGIEMDDGTMHWSTVSSISAGDTVTIGDATPDTAAVGNHVYWFTSRAQRFVHLESALLRNADNNNDIPLQIIRTTQEYDYGIADKYSDGTPTAILVEPQRLNTRIWLDTQPNDMGYFIVLTAMYPAEDYDATSNDIAFPQEWYAALSWELAFRLCPSKGSNWTQAMETNRQNALMLARSVNPEVSSLYFQPNA